MFTLIFIFIFILVGYIEMQIQLVQNEKCSFGYNPNHQCSLRDQINQKRFIVKNELWHNARSMCSYMKVSLCLHKKYIPVVSNAKLKKLAGCVPLFSGYDVKHFCFVRY